MAWLTATSAVMTGAMRKDECIRIASGNGGFVRAIYACRETESRSQDTPASRDAPE